MPVCGGGHGANAEPTELPALALPRSGSRVCGVAALSALCAPLSDMKLFPGRYQRIVAYALLCVVVAHDLWVLPRRPPGDRLADLNVYLGSVRGLLAGGSLYDFHAGNGAPFTYPPLRGCFSFPSWPFLSSERSGHWPRSSPGIFWSDR